MIKVQLDNVLKYNSAPDRLSFLKVFRNEMNNRHCTYMVLHGVKRS